MEDRHQERVSGGIGKKRLTAEPIDLKHKTKYKVVRMCAACRRKEDRTVLIRIGLDEGGAPAIWAGRGRSAYSHAVEDCIIRITNKGVLDRSLRRKLDGQARERLRDKLLCQLR